MLLVENFKYLLVVINVNILIFKFSFPKMFSMNIKALIQKIYQGLRLFIQQCRRVLLVSTKPNKEEFKLSSKITGIGFIVIGLIGFVIFLIFQFLGI